jgi:hypothetical protein
MRKRFFLVAVLGAALVAAGPVNTYAQDHAPEGEIFIGGSKLWEHASGGPYHNHGLKVAITGNFNRFLGLEIDLSKFQGVGGVAPPAYTDCFRFLAGPHIAYSGSSRMSPFAHVLVGGTYGRQIIPPPYPPGVIPNTASDLRGKTAFTVVPGGGLDVKVLRFLWIRPIQADYVRAFFPTARENNLQLSFGLTLRFGSRTKSASR